MNAISDFVADGLQDLESDLGPETFTWKGVEVPCIPSSLKAGSIVVFGGHELAVTLTLVVRKSNFLTADSSLLTVDSDLVTVDQDMPHPVAGKTLVFRSKTYRILSAKEPSTRSHYELDLGDPNQ